MCAELPPEYEALLGALRDRDHADDWLQAAEDRVRQWSWRRAPSGVEHEELAWAERETLLPSEETGGHPPAGIAADRIGRDERGELVFAELQNELGELAGQVGREAVGGRATTLVVGGAQREVSRAWRDGADLLRVQRASRTGRERFEFLDERYDRRSPELTVITQVRSQYRRGRFEQLPSRELHVVYGREGGVAAIEEPGVEILYQRPTLTGSELAERLKAFASRLADAVFELVLAAAPQAGLGYAVMLVYEGADAPRLLLPQPLWGLEARRSRLLGDPERRFTVWDPAAFRWLTEDVDWDKAADLRAEAQLLGSELATRGAFEQARGVVVAVTADLNRRSWTQVPVTGDFVAVVGDYEMADVHENLRRALTPEQWRRLEAGGWV
jgi:hypothetical protein